MRGAMVRIPAELTRMSSEPRLARVSATTVLQPSSLVTSSSAKWAASPSWSASALPSPGRMSAMTTLAPSSTNSWAVAAPRPRDPPVMSATFESSRPMSTLQEAGATSVAQDLFVLAVERAHERRQLQHLLDRALHLDLLLGHGQRHVHLAQPELVGGVGGHEQVDVDIDGDVGAALHDALA